ncbi:MAG: guided entry of tail-anchored proteins factor 1 [Bacteroidota bacterium]|nr:guided entry of tail-anchored proteins factor 1 [Bacteroidota bacterium]
MNLKRSIATVVTASFLGLAGMPAMADAPGKEIKIDQENFEKLSAAEQERVLEIKAQLEQIYNTDRSTLSKEERREMRAELKELKEEVNVINAQQPVIYISLTALLIIILLIILL